MRKTRRRFLAAVGATFTIAGCQDDGAGPTPEGSPGVGDGESPGAGDGVGEGTEDGVGDGTEEDGVGDGTEEDGMGDGTEEDGVGEDTEEEGAGDGTEEGDTADGTEEDGAGGDGAQVDVSEHDEYGEILVDGEGMTLYAFQEDSQDAEESACTDDCASNWPPLTATGEPTAGDGVEAELSTFERGDGDTQVTANGWPLYYFADDAAAGDANGQGVNDVWFVVDPSGEPIMEGSAGTGTGTEAGDGTATEAGDGTATEAGAGTETGDGA